MSKLLSLARLHRTSPGAAALLPLLDLLGRRPYAARSVLWPRSRRWQRRLPNPRAELWEPAAMGINVWPLTPGQVRAGVWWC